ncbi:MAG TPA: hypothetical protein VE981_09460 [Planctomycetota bacterium]|nr:hypothetical protein [Planctomycetota bacterium]
MAPKLPSLDARRYFRRWVRNEVHLPAKVEILTLVGKKVNDGSAVVRDVSLRGALLTRIKLKKKVLPASAFRVRVTFTSDKYKGIGALCRPIRFGRGTDFELAVEFEDFWARTGSK